MSEDTSASTPPVETDGAFDAQSAVFRALTLAGTIGEAVPADRSQGIDWATVDVIVDAAYALASLVEEVDTFVSNGGVITLTPTGTFTGSYRVPGRP